MSSNKLSSKNVCKPYVVVEFYNDKPIAVEAIPRKWLINDQQCFWPVNLKTTQLNKLLFNPNSTPPKDSKTCMCRVLGQAENYIEANAIAKIAEDQSDVENSLKSDKRARRKPKKFPETRESESDKDDSSEEGTETSASKQVPAKPAIIQFPFSLCSNTDLLNLQTPGPIQNIQPGRQPAPENQQLSIEIEVDPAFLKEPEKITNQVDDVLPIHTPNGSGLQITDEGEDIRPVSTPAGSVLDHQFQSQSQPTTPRTTRTDSRIPFNDGSFQGLVLKHLAALNVKTNSILERLQKIEESLANTGNTTGSAVLAQADFTTIPLFPLDNEQQLVDLENQLQLEEERNNLISYLSLIGGNGVNDTLKNIIKRIISHDLALRITYTGKGNNKTAFRVYKELELCIIAATRRNKKGSCQSATEDEIQDFLKDIFRYIRPRKPNE